MFALDDHTKVWSFDQCGYAFLGDPESYRFSAFHFNDSSFQQKIEESVPVVVDWAIGGRNCSEATSFKDYACLGNSFCVDSDTGLKGYRCRCLEGYHGSPYVSPGCTGTFFFNYNFQD